MDDENFKQASQVKVGDKLVGVDGETLTVRAINKGVYPGHVCFSHKKGFSEIHKDDRVGIAQ